DRHRLPDPLRPCTRSQYSAENGPSAPCPLHGQSPTSPGGTQTWNWLSLGGRILLARFASAVHVRVARCGRLSGLALAGRLAAAPFRDIHDFVLENKEIRSAFARQPDHVPVIIFNPTA